MSRGRDPLAWLTLAAVVLTASATVAWVWEDDFLDGDEAQHAMRTLATLDGLRDWRAGRVALTEVLAPRLEQVKPWYGFPFYLTGALLWRAVGVRPDAVVLLNLPALAVLLASSRWLAGRLGGETAIAPALLFLVALPGTMIWAHVFSPTLVIAAAVTLASAVMVASSGFARFGTALLAGVLTAVAALAKVSSPAYVLLLVPLLPLATPRPWRRAVLGAAVFAAGLAPAALWWLPHRDVLSFWSTMAEGLFRPATVAEPFLSLGRSSLAVFGLVPLAILLVAAALGVWGGSAEDRRRVLALVACIAAPLVLLFAASGNTGTSRDHLPLAAPAALIVALASVRLAPPRRIAFGLAMLAQGLVHAAASLIPATPTWLAGAVDGRVLLSPPGIAVPRRTPRPNPVPRVLDELGARLPGTTPSRCGCLPFPPYPTPGARERPVVLVDSGLLGPENLEARIALQGERPAWQFGNVPYGLGCGAYRAATECAAAVLVGPPGFTSADAGFDIAGARLDRRTLVRSLGRDAGTMAVGAGGPLAVRLADHPGWCQAGPEQRRERAEALHRECGDDFFALHLSALAAEGAERNALATRAAELAARRRDELHQGKDAGAVRFGEESLAAAIAASPSPP